MSKNQNFITRPFELGEIYSIAQEVIDTCKKESIWLFDGTMGAGKTTLVKAICQKLGVLNTVQSPTFSIVNEYLTHNNDIIYHFDCYRLKNEAEAYNIGLEEYLDSGHLCFIEWPNKIQDLLPDNVAHIHIEEVTNGKRQVSIEIQDAYTNNGETNNLLR